MAADNVSGLDDVLKNLNAAIGGIRGQTAEGIELAGQFVKGEAMELTSVDHGILIKSAFSTPAGTKDAPAVVVGYSAKYAPYVHAMPENTEWNRPGAENEFLEKAVTRNLSKIVNIIANTAKRLRK